MKLTVRAKAFPNFGKDNRAHFLVAGATVTCNVSFENGTTFTLTGTKTAPSTFSIDIDAATVPNRLQRNGQSVLEQGAPAKQQITRIDIDYKINVKLGRLTFPALRIEQRFIPTPRDPNGRNRIDYSLVAGSWRDWDGRRRIANTAVHPLVDLTSLATGDVVVNTLMLDITPGWEQLHRNNGTYKLYDALSAGHGLTFKVFAHTAGIPLIWYAVVPNQLRGMKAVSPHMFLQPSDNREGQWPRNDEEYLLRNDQFFETDGQTLMKYLIAPIPDTGVRSAGPAVGLPKQRRNVVNFRKAVLQGRETGEMTTDHWNIGAGLQKAFEHVGSGVPAQFLLVPQRVGQAASGMSDSYGGAVTLHLPSITDAVFGVIESNTNLTASGADVLLPRDKIIISAYSESGFDLWNVSRPLQDKLKAIIAIEPQNLNSIQNDYRPTDSANNRVGAPPLIGKDVIPDLLKRKVLVFIIGRHHAQYAPQVPDPSKVHRLPVQAAAVFRYPPDPTVNDFIKYRVHRMMVPSDDPFMLQDETAILAAFAAQGISGAAVLPRIFGPKGNRDESSTDGVSRWYSHQFALSGGDEMHLDPSGVYDKPVKYRTWFEVAVHEIG